MTVNAIVRTTQNCGDHARETVVAVAPREGEAVAEFVARIFGTLADDGEWVPGRKFDPEHDHIELRIVN